MRRGCAPSAAGRRSNRGHRWVFSVSRCAHASISASPRLVALSLGIAVFGVQQLSGIGNNVGKMNALAGNTERVLKLTRDLEANRRAETRYLMDAQESSMKDAKQSASAANALLDEAARATLSEERRKIDPGVQDTLRAHGEKLDQFSQLTAAWVAERAKLFTGGDALTAAAGRSLEAARATQRNGDGRNRSKCRSRSTSGARGELAVHGHRGQGRNSDIQDQFRTRRRCDLRSGSDRQAEGRPTGGAGRRRWPPTRQVSTLTQRPSWPRACFTMSRCGRRYCPCSSGSTQVQPR